MVRLRAGEILDQYHAGFLAFAHVQGSKEARPALDRVIRSITDQAEGKDG